MAGRYIAHHAPIDWQHAGRLRREGMPSLSSWLRRQEAEELSRQLELPLIGGCNNETAR